MPQPTKPQLAIYAAFAIAVLLIGARFLRSGDGAEPPAGAGVAAAGAGAGGALGSADGAGSGGGSGGPLAEAGGGAGGSAGVGGVAGATGSLVVDVKGAVRRQGVYRLPAGSRVLDAVRRAGGVTRRADRLGVNLAARVVDGGEVVVPRKGEAGGGGLAASGSSGGGSAAGPGSSGGAAGAGAGAAAGAPLAIDVNTASAQELEQLDGVGPATAAKIVAYREQNGGFRSIDELDEVSGIGEAKMAAIRAQLGL